MSLKQQKIKIKPRIKLNHNVYNTGFLVSQSIWWPASINWIRPCCMESLVKSPCQSKFMFPVIPSVPLTLRQVLWLLFMHNIKYFLPLRLLQDYNCVQSCSNSCALCVMFHGALSTHRRAGKTDRRYAVFLCAHHHLTCMCTKLFAVHAELLATTWNSRYLNLEIARGDYCTHFDYCDSIAIVETPLQ